MAKILKFPLKHPSQSPENGINKEFTDFVSQLQANSLEEANQKLAVFQNQTNLAGRSDFLGLSPNQIHDLLYSPFQNGSFLTIAEGDASEFADVPVVKQALFMLREIEKAQGVKLTQMGKLPRALVRDFWTQFVKSEVEHWVPNKEEDCRQIVYCRTILEGAGFLKKEKAKILITKKGAAQLKAGVTAEFYRHLFSAVFNKWNWAYGDRYDQLQIIQMAGLFNLFALSKVTETAFFPGKTVSQVFLQAFPNAVREVTHFWSPPEEQVRNCFEIRFLERVCVPLGILNKKDDGSIAARDRSLYKLTPLFREKFRF